MAAWRRVTWKDYVIRTHIVCREMEDLVIADMAARDPDVPVDKAEDHTEDGINLPGMIAMYRPNETIYLDGLQLEIPSEDVEPIIGMLESLPLRRFGEVPYYKLHSFLRCTVLSPEQHAALLSILRDLLPSANQRAEAFYQKQMLPSEALRLAASVTLSIPVDQVPDLGGHRADRLKPTA